MQRNLLIVFVMILMGSIFLAFFGNELSVVEQEEADAELVDCGALVIRNIAPFHVGFSYSNKQNHEGTRHILNEPSRITSTEFFPALIWKSADNFDFSGADKAVDNAIQHGKVVHAHCLLYALETVNPLWLRKADISKEEFEKLVKDFITVTVSRYKGKVKSYDVANELFSYNSSKVAQTWIREKFSSDKEYLDFIGRCFRYAHAADPDAFLFYNDYGQENTANNFEKGRGIVAQIEKWKKDGVPIHGYGLQMHTNIYRPVKHIEEALQLAVSTGLLIHVSELDVSVNYADWDIILVKGGEKGVELIGASHLQKQKEMYKSVAAAYRRIIPKPQQYGITLWDLSDKYSWLNEQRYEAPTLFDTNFQRKPAYYGFLEGISGKKFECE